VRAIELTTEQQAALLATNPARNGQLLGMRVRRERLRQAVVNRPSSASKRLKGNTLPYGTARIAVHSTFIVQSIYGAIQEYAGIDRPEWLDL